MIARAIVIAHGLTCVVENFHMDNFLQHLKEQGFSANTCASYDFALKQLFSRHALPLTSQDLLAHKDWLQNNFSAKTVNARITAINAYLDFTHAQTIRLRSLKIQQKPFLDNVISGEEYVHLRQSLYNEKRWFWFFLVRFLGETGARVSEVRMFSIPDVYAGHLDIVSKGDKLRRIYIPTKLQNDTIAWCENEERSQGFLFAGKNYNAPMTARGISLGLKRSAKRYGINPDVIYPHSFRHLFAKNFIKRTPDIALLADLMGHESIETTRIYLRRTAAEQRQAVDDTVTW